MKHFVVKIILKSSGYITVELKRPIRVYPSKFSIDYIGYYVSPENKINS